MKESNSSLTTFTACPRKYQYLYMDLIKPESSSDAINLGTIGHDMLEKYYLKEPEPTFYEDINFIKAQSLVRGYISHYSKETDFNPIQVETSFEGELTADDILTGKIDLYGAINGKNWLVDHKFKASLGDRAHWRINYQADIYLHSLLKGGDKIEGICWNLIRSPSIRQKQNETLREYGDRLFQDTLDRPEFYFARYFIKRDDKEINDNIAEVLQKFQILRFCKDNNLFPKSPASCHQYGRCKFLDLCADGIEDGLVQKTTKHEEIF